MIPDNYDKWKQHDAEQEAKLENLPVCEYCGMHIQDDYYFEIEGVIICEECLNDNFRKDVEYD
jgi:formylmethanofuran dehydrogenase subunit E